MSALDTLIENTWTQATNIVHEVLSCRHRKTARTGFTNICCPMCVYRGESADRKFRCGVILDQGIGVSCFNCGFRTKWQKGERMPSGMRKFLEAMGANDRQIQIAAYMADQTRLMMVDRPDIQAKHNVSLSLDFQTIDLPPKTKSLQDWINYDCNDPDFLKAINYLLSRGDTAVKATTYYWSETKEYRDRLIIPCTHQNNIVGWMARAVDINIQPRYLKNLPSNFLFNSRVMFIPERKYVLICEGIFDALVIDGVGALGARLNDIQIAWIKSSGKQPVIVPDRDKPGGQLIDIALKHNWLVAFPNYGNKEGGWWDSDVKDPDEAVKRYGKLYTIQSIFSSLTADTTKIKQRMTYKAK